MALKTLGPDFRNLQKHSTEGQADASEIVVESPERTESSPDEGEAVQTTNKPWHQKLPDTNQLRTAGIQIKQYASTAYGLLLIILLSPITITARTIDFVWENKRELVVLAVVLSLSISFTPASATWVLPQEYGASVDDTIKSSVTGLGGVVGSVINSTESNSTEPSGTAASNQPTAENVGTSESTTAELSTNELQQHIHSNVNSERTERSLGDLNYDSQLEEIARYHSKDMAQNDYFAHDSPSGETLEDRYEKFGYDCRVSAGGNRFYSGAENIAYSYYEEPIEGGEYYDSPEELAEGVVDQWMNSRGHRENILMPSWRNEGIGVYVEEVPEGTRVYVTQNFC